MLEEREDGGKMLSVTGPAGFCKYKFMTDLSASCYVN